MPAQPIPLQECGRRQGVAFAYRGPVEAVKFFDRLVVRYSTWAEMEPGLVYVMLRFHTLTRLRDVLKCVVTWNEMHVPEEQMELQLLPGMQAYVESYTNHEITRALLELQAKGDPRFNLVTTGAPLEMHDFKQISNKPPPIDRATKVARENVELRDLVAYLKARLAMYEAPGEQPEPAGQPIKAASALVLAAMPVGSVHPPAAASEPGAAASGPAAASEPDVIRPLPTNQAAPVRPWGLEGEEVAEVTNVLKPEVCKEVHLLRERGYIQRISKEKYQKPGRPPKRLKQAPSVMAPLLPGMEQGERPFTFVVVSAPTSAPLFPRAEPGFRGLPAAPDIRAEKGSVAFLCDPV